MRNLNPLGSDPRPRPRPFSFRPPKNSRLVSWLCRLLLPFNLRSKLKVTQVDIEDNTLALLKSLRGKRCLLTPSHSGGFEPYILIHLSHLLGDDFNYMAARETFSLSPVAGWFMQGIGAYSVIRGAADRQSFQMTRQLLVKAKRWLVVFPEGQTVWQGDTVIPFQQGIIQLAFKAYQKVAASDPGASLTCVPMAVKYAYTKDMRAEIDASLCRLEDSLVPEPADPDPGPLERLRVISDAVLASHEKMRGLEPSPDDSLDDRIQRMKEAVVRRIEQQLQVTPRAD
ncbi:MAG: 1-acyl-sn-glycerol-3-phosphate acyltransferase, partial [Lentisphaerae bacterium]|nr:1-acyl-sn-glycerol-3-phosphate acyltransferase [Lentisphaerota bacterium]